MTISWSPCKNFEDAYEISTDGQLRSIDRFFPRKNSNKPVFYKGKLIKFTLNRHGYFQVKLSYKGLTTVVKLHRLVATTFIDNPENKPQVNHINGIKTDNNVTNLEWMTNSENVIHASLTGLRKYETGKKSNNFCGTIFVYMNGKLIEKLNGTADMTAKGFDYRLVNACVNGKRKTHKGCTFTRQQKEI